MNKRLIALLLTLALSLSVGMVSALADEETAPAEPETEQQDSLTVTVEETEASTGGTDTQAGETIPVVLVPEVTPNTVLFADLEGMIRKNSPAYGAMMSNIGAIEEAQEQLETLEKSMEQLQSGLSRVEASLAIFEGRDDLAPEEQALKAELLDQKNSLMQRQQQVQTGMSGIASLAAQDTAQVEIGAKQFIMGCQTAYISLVDLGIQEASLERQLAAVDRMLAAMQVRRDGEQISELQMRQLESNRASLVSGLETLRVNADGLRMQLEYMLGEEITGTLETGVLPKVTAEELDAIDPEEDLKLALRRNLSISAAEESWRSVADSAPGGDLGEHLLDAADYGVENAELQAEMQYRALYAQLQDKRQALAAASAALEVAQAVYDAEALKYERGSISNHAFLDAEDTLLSAKDAVVQAENALFGTYNQYTWAVKYGVFS